MTSYRLSAPALSQTNIEIVPGIFPLIRSWLGAVTRASATSALVSETRVIVVPTSSTIERPTRRRTVRALVTTDHLDGGWIGTHCRRRRRRSICSQRAAGVHLPDGHRRAEQHRRT